jgi:hypothetical protein
MATSIGIESCYLLVRRPLSRQVVRRFTSMTRLHRRCMNTSVVAAWMIAGCLVACDLLGASKPQPVETAEAAIAAAKIGFQGVYDKASSQSELSPESVAHFEPYTATLHDGWWEVIGTRHGGYQGRMPRARVARNDGRVVVTVDKEDERR